MRAFAVLSLVAFSGCASDGAVRVFWEKVDDAKLQRVCNAPGDLVRVNGCAKVAGDMCIIYTRAEGGYSGQFDYHQTLGHELRHCFEGAWHK